MALLLKPDSPTPSNGSCGTEQLQRGGAVYTSDCVQPKHYSNTHRHIRQRQYIAQRIHRLTLNVVEHAQHSYRSSVGKVSL